MEPILEITNLRKEYEDFALKDISLTLQSGYIMGFIGPNGAGKTTTIKLILNLIKRDRGLIKVFGMDNIKHEAQIKNRVGFILDQNGFYDEISVKEMKNIIASFYKRWDNKKFDSYMKKFELPYNKKIKELSKGMKMKFSLAVALSHNADLLILDEPTSGLDPVARSELIGILSDFIQDENKAVFFSTHITSDLDKIADYVTFINNGEIVFSTAKDDILESYGIVKGPSGLINDDNKALFIGLRENRFGFEALVRNKEQARKVFGDKIVIEKPVIEDIMVYYTSYYARRAEDV